MANSNAPGETIKLGRDECKIVIQARIRLTPRIINELAPHDKNALTAMRRVLDDGLRLKLIEHFTNNYFSNKDESVMVVNDVDVIVIR